MRALRNIIAFVLLAILAAGCSACGTRPEEGRGENHVAQPSDTLYTKDAAMEVYASDFERALLIIDSAEIVGNINSNWADLLRAKVFSSTCEDLNYDTAILIGERLMEQEDVMDDLDMQEDVLEILLNACRMRKDYEPALHWATELDDLYQSRGELTEALRTDAEIGTLLVRIGQQEEGLWKIDSVIRQLEGKRKFNELDALIIALKRKAEICIEKSLYAEAIPVAQRILSELDDYELHAASFHDGSVREPSDDDRPDYIDFYRGKAYGYLATAHASLGDSAKAWEYLALYEQTAAGQSLTGRFMIAPTLMDLGEYDRVLAIYDEVEQRMGTDTLNENYLSVLRNRAQICDVQGRHEEAKDYWRRQGALGRMLNENLLQSKAHLYAARFNASEQQREIERHRAAARRAQTTLTAFGIIGLLVLLFALFAVRQWYKMQKHNRILAAQITEAVKYKEKYKELKHKMEAPAPKAGSGEVEIRPQGDGDVASPVSDSPVAAVTEPATDNAQPTSDDFPQPPQSDSELFDYLRDLIEREQLFLDPNFERQRLIQMTGLSKERIGAALSQSGGHGMTALVREMRLEYAVRIMNEQPELTIEQVCQASGFTNADTFTRNFRSKYGMTPTAYRGSKD